MDDDRLDEEPQGPSFPIALALCIIVSVVLLLGLAGLINSGRWLVWVAS